MKRRLPIILGIVILVSIFKINVFAKENDCSVVFKNADTDSAINKISDEKNICAEVSFLADETGYANIITACYDAKGTIVALPIVENVPITEGVVCTHTTADFSLGGIEEVRVFAWSSSTLTPQLKNNGVLSKTFLDNPSYFQKFSAISGATEDNPYIIVSDSTISIGELFSASDVQNKYLSISAQKIGDGSVEAIASYDKSDWTKSSITFSGAGLIKLTIQDYSFCLPTDCYVKVIEPQDTYSSKFKNISEYIYRVGNKNNVKAGSLFEATDVEYGMKNTTITVKKVAGNANATVVNNASDWTLSELTFTGTGILEITIKDAYSKPVALNVEVVDAYNVTQYSQMKSSGNVVLLNDIAMSSNAQFKIEKSTLYGNGFTFDVTNGKTAGANVDANYLVLLKNSILDNVKITGAVYTQYGTSASDSYNNPVILSMGSSVIANCYISNCAAPVRMKGDELEIVNTTLKGGIYANLDIRNGVVTLENVTTINQTGLNDKAADGSAVVGLGVAIYYEGVLDSTKVNVKGSLKQYNHLSEADSANLKDKQAQALFNAMFGYTNLIYKDADNVKWINTGILSMTSTVAENNITQLDGYISETPEFAGKYGYVHTPIPAAPESPAAEYKAEEQYHIAPLYSFDYTNINYEAKTADSNRYCYYDNGIVMIAFDNGDSFNWNTSILSVEKNKAALPYTVLVDGVDYTGRSITFDSSGEHTVEYSYTDPYNYRLGENGEVDTYEKAYKKYVHINVSEIMPNAKNAEFTFGSNNTASKKVMIGNDIYVMPDDTSLRSTTVSGVKVYYPTVEMFTSDGKWEHSSLNSWCACFPVFNEVVTITDYADKGTGAKIVYNSSTTTLPSGLSVPIGADEAFRYGASAPAPSKPSVKNGVLCYTSSTLSNNARGDTNVLVTYKYQDNAGAAYYYYVNYHCKAVTVKSDTCVTGDTLITLADESKKRIDEVTYQDELMVWNFYDGRYECVPAAIIFEHDYADNTIIRLSFDDGTMVKISNIHQFFDANENKFVNITADTVADYVGHNFVKRDGDRYKYVRLEDYEIYKDYCKTYGIISAVHYNILIEDIISTDYEAEDFNLFNYFEYGDNMMFDKEKMVSDIEKYGLYSYDDFDEYLTKEQFDAFNVGFMKIAVGKSNYTYEGILRLIDEYLK